MPAFCDCHLWRLVLLLTVVAVAVSKGQTFSGVDPDRAAALEECIGSNGGMKRQLRSDGLNLYLFGLAKCVASVGRPRFGKRSGAVTAVENEQEHFLEALRDTLDYYFKNRLRPSQTATGYPTRPPPFYFKLFHPTK